MQEQDMCREQQMQGTKAKAPLDATRHLGHCKVSVALKYSCLHLEHIQSTRKLGRYVKIRTSPYTSKRCMAQEHAHNTRCGNSDTKAATFYQEHVSEILQKRSITRPVWVLLDVQVSVSLLYAQQDPLPVSLLLASQC